MQLAITTLYVTLGCAFALWRGGQPERLVAAFQLGNYVLDLSYHLIFGWSNFRAIDPGHMVMDTTCFVAYLWIALQANRAWTLWISASQIIIMLGHLCKLLEVRAVARGYWAMAVGPGLFQIAILVIGTQAHVLRVRRIGSYNHWRVDPATVAALYGGADDERGQILAAGRH